MIKSILCYFVVCFSFAAGAGLTVHIKGRVLRIENGDAIVKETTGETRVPLKKLSKKDKEAIMAASASKKEVSLNLAPQVFMKEEN